MHKIVSVVLFVVTIVVGTPTIISRSEWGARSPRHKEIIGDNQEYVIIHHTETPECDSKEACIARVQNIQNYHMDVRKWDDIGYNFLVDPQGLIYEGRGWGIKGAHAPNYNQKSIGISVIGNYEDKNPSNKATSALKELIALGVSNQKISSDYKLLGHKQVRATECPGNSFYTLIKTWPHWRPEP